MIIKIYLAASTIYSIAILTSDNSLLEEATNEFSEQANKQGYGNQLSRDCPWSGWTKV